MHKWMMSVYYCIVYMYQNDSEHLLSKQGFQKQPTQQQEDLGDPYFL